MSSLFTRALPLLFVISCILPSLWFGQDRMELGRAVLGSIPAKVNHRQASLFLKHKLEKVGLLCPGASVLYFTKDQGKLQ